MKAKSFCWLSLALSLALAASMALPSEAAAQTHIMPLGNSITDGDGSTNGGGYRYFLYNKLQDANIAFDFVGSLTSGSGFPDNDHEGHGGFRADQLAVQTYLTNNPPEVVFLEIGTNDVSVNESATQIKNDIESLVDQIHSFDANIEIYLGTIIPRKDSSARQTVTDDLNALLPALVSAKSTAGYKIYLVDHAARFKADPNWQTNLMIDDLHPNDAGYDLMAQEWFTAYVSNSGSPVTQFSDNFDSGVLGGAWAANPAFQVQSGQLVNTSAVDAFDNFIAVPSVIDNANVVGFAYGSQSDFTGRSYTGAAVMLDAASTTANGYLIFHNSELKKVRLYNVVNGIPGAKIAEAATQAPDPDAGHTFRVEWTTDSNGHHFCVYINDVLDACVSDANKLQGNAAKLYAGVMVNGNTNNAIDDFYTAKVSDSTPPAAVSDLNVTEVSALSATLEWTAPGDDGNTGQARSYQLRYSTEPITASNFSSATPVTDLPQPGPAGAAQSATVAGLASGTTYYFALKTADEFDNLSALSNVASATTTSLNLLTDNFNRQGPALGDNWAAAPELQIINGTVQNTSNADLWSAAIYKYAKNPVSASIKWGPKATLYGTNWCGVLVMASQADPALVDGYMIQRFDEGGVTRLWRVSNGQFAGVIDEGNSLAPDPKPGSVMNVLISSDNNGHHFDVFIDDVFDRVLTDPQKLEGNTSPLYAGFYVNSPLDSLNAIDSFSAGILPGTPTTLVKVSGDNQSKPVGQALAQPLVVRLLDQNQNPMAGMVVNFVVTSGSATVNNPPAADDNIRLEAENALITAPIETRNDPEAAGGKYIAYPVGQTVDASATLTFVINQAGSYRVWTRSQKTGSQPGSWTISVDGGPDFIYDVFQGSTRSTWTWDLMSQRRSDGTQIDPKVLNLTAGTHTIEFKARWEDTRLDKILITNDAGYTPDGKEEVGYLTDADGAASATVTMGSTVGTVKINAVHGNLAPAVFTATATAAVADSLALAGGSGQSGPAGQTLAQPLKVNVTDNFGNAIANKSVSWIVTQGNGKLGNYTSTSDVNGIASTTFVPGNRSANNKVSARATYSDSQVEFTATTTAGIADAAAVVSGSGQTGAVGSSLVAPLVLKVTDATGNAVANYPVEAIVTRGGGTVSASNPVRNGSFESASGSAPANWNLEGSPSASEVSLSNDARAGNKSLRVNSTRAGVGVSQLCNYDANTAYTLYFWAKVRSGTARVTWRLNDAGGNQIDETFDITFAASDSVWRQYILSAQNGAAGTRNLWIRTSGGGEFFIDEVKILRHTGSNGQLSMVWTLGDTAMTQQVVVNDGALIDNRGPLKGFPLTFTANAQGGAPKTLAIQSGNGQIGLVGQPLPLPLTVKVSDGFGNGVGKVNVTFTAIAGGGKFSGNVTTKTVPTDSLGIAGIILTLGPTPGQDNNQVRATTNPALNGSPIVFTASASIDVPVDLTSFTASVGDGFGVKLSWITGSEFNNIGFNVLRSQAPGGRYTELNDKLIPANRDGRYTFIDKNAVAGARYYYKLEVLDTRGNVTTYGPIIVSVTAPTTFELSQNYPNPFWSGATSRAAGNPTTNINYQLPQAVQVSLTIYNMLGQEVRKLVNTQKLAGYHTVVWDGRDNTGRRVPSGVYHYRLQAGNFIVTKRMLLAK